MSDILFLSEDAEGVRADLRVFPDGLPGEGVGKSRRGEVHLVRIGRAVATDDDVRLAVRPFKDEAARIGKQFAVIAALEYRGIQPGADVAELFIEGAQFFVDAVPREAIAAERILIAFRARLVAVIDAGNAEERECALLS